MAGALPEFAIPQTVGAAPPPAIKQAEILAFVNRALAREETDISVELRSVVDDLADLHVLRGVDTQELTSTSDRLVYPADSLTTDQAILSVQLRSPAGVWDAPLRPWPGGIRDHNRFYEGNPSRSTPEYYVAMQSAADGWCIFVDPRPASDRTAWIHYYRQHQQDLTSLEFPTEWRRAVNFGAAMEVAATYGLEKSVALWGARYQNEKEKRRILAPREPAIMEA